MKKPVFVLLALLSLLPFAQSLAQTAQTPPVVTPAAPESAPESMMQFLATLSDGQAQTPSDLTPVPSFMTGCVDNSQCPTGEICCYLCGNPPAEGDDSFCRGCVTPVKGRCPLVV